MSDAERLRRALRSQVRRGKRDVEGPVRAAAVVPPLALPARHADALAPSASDALTPRLHGEMEHDEQQDEVQQVIDEVLEYSVAPDPFEEHPLARAEALAALVHDGPRAFGLSRLPAAFHALSGADKLDWLLALPSPRASIQALPAEELVFLLDEIGHADAGELLALASARQLQAAVDLDVWRGDRLDRRAFAHLLAVAVAAGPEVVDRFLAAQEDGVIVAFFIRSATVYEQLEEAEQCAPDDAEVFLAPDGQLVVAIDGEDNALGPIRVMLESLFRTSIERGRRILRACRWELPESLVEDLYDHRSRRIAELGFLPREQARELFRFVDPDQARAELEERLAGVSDVQPDALRPYHADAAAPPPARTDLALRELPEPTLLAEAAARLPVAEQARVQTGLVFLAYRVQAALAQRFDDTEVLGDHARHALFTVDAGLAHLARGRVEVAAAMLATTPVDTIFTAGHSLVVRLHHRAVALRRRLGPQRRVALLDGRDGAIVAGLLRPLPLWPRSASERVAAAVGRRDADRVAAAAAAVGSPIADEPDDLRFGSRHSELDDDNEVFDADSDEEGEAQRGARDAGLRPYEREAERVAADAALAGIAAQIELIERAAGGDLPAALDGLEGELGDRASDVTLSALLATAVVHALLGGTPRLEPLDAATLERLLRTAMAGPRGDRRLRPELRLGLTRALLAQPGLDDTAAAALDAALGAALDRLDAELGGLWPDDGIDLRFVGASLLFR